jgi:hypothetical protein
LTTLTNRAESVVGAGRGALIEAMFGAGWLGWGLGEAKAFNEFVGPAFGLTAILLWAYSIYMIRSGRKLENRFPAVPDSVRRAIAKSFLLVVLAEVVAIILVFIVASWLHRPDLAADWCALIVGLHFLPLAKIFRAPRLGVFGILIVVWCVFCWARFRSNALVISAALGTGILLWVASVVALLRARKIAQSLRAIESSGSRSS